MKKVITRRSCLNIDEIFSALNPQGKTMINLTEAFKNSDNLTPKHRDIMQPLLQEYATKKRALQISERDLRSMFNSRRQQTFSSENRYRTTGRSASRLKRRVRELSLERTFIQTAGNYMGRRSSVKTPRASIPSLTQSVNNKLKDSLKLDLSVITRPKETRSVLTMLNHTPHNVNINVKF